MYTQPSNWVSFILESVSESMVSYCLSHSVPSESSLNCISGHQPPPSLLSTTGLPVSLGSRFLFFAKHLVGRLKGGWAGRPHGASRSLPIRLVVGRLWRREVWAPASRTAASLGREKIERGKGAELSKQPVSFWAWQLLMLSQGIKLIC